MIALGIEGYWMLGQLSVFAVMAIGLTIQSYI